LLTLVRCRVRAYTCFVAGGSEIEFIFEPQEEGGYYVYAPDLPGLHTQGDTLEEARANAEEALTLYVEGLREAGRPLRSGVIRHKLRVPA
jgi:antitoxin HicB